MKRIFALLLLLVTLTGCSVPNSLQLDLSQGYGWGMKLLHLNASSADKRQRILDFAEIFEDAQVLDKDIAMFAYYPDYLLEINDGGVKTSAVVDINGEFVDFYYTDEGVLYRSAVSARDFKNLLHQRS